MSTNCVHVLSEQTTEFVQQLTDTCSVWGDTKTNYYIPKYRTFWQFKLNQQNVLYLGTEGILIIKTSGELFYIIYTPF